MIDKWRRAKYNTVFEPAFALVQPLRVTKPEFTSESLVGLLASQSANQGNQSPVKWTVPESVDVAATAAFETALAP